MAPNLSPIYSTFLSLDAFRPLGAHAPEPQIAEAQRREFFAQFHRWTRQDYAVHVFCNNTGERQRFEEIWKDYGFGDEHLNDAARPKVSDTSKAELSSPSPPSGKRAGVRGRAVQAKIHFRPNRKTPSPYPSPPVGARGPELRQQFWMRNSINHQNFITASPSSCTSARSAAVSCMKPPGWLW